MKKLILAVAGVALFSVGFYLGCRTSLPAQQIIRLGVRTVISHRKQHDYDVVEQDFPPGSYATNSASDPLHVIVLVPVK